MECGKIKSPGLPIFYFVIDPVTPEKPQTTRVRTYYVVSHIDSYVEAYYYLARFMSAPQTSLDDAIRRWHALYTRVFGTVSEESFRKSLLSVPVEHFSLASTEEQAREKAQTHLRESTMEGVTVDRDPRRSPSRSHRDDTAVSGIDPGRPDPSAIRPSALGASTAEAKSLFAEHQSNVERRRAVDASTSGPSPADRSAASRYADASAIGRRDPAAETSRPNLNVSGVLSGAPPHKEDARVELHRLRAEHAHGEASNIDYSRAKVNALSDAERAALLYQLTEARKEASNEKAMAREASERLRTMTRNLEERIDALVKSHEATLRDRAAKEHERLTELEDEFLEREKKLTREYDEALHDRDRRLSRAVTKIKGYESHLEDALRRIEEQKVKLQEATMKAAEATSERQSMEEDQRRLQRTIHNLEIQVDDANRAASNAEDAQRRAEHEAAELRIEVARLKRENERYAHFSHSLHRELQQLDDSAITAAEILRRRVFASRRNSEDDGAGTAF